MIIFVTKQEEESTNAYYTHAFIRKRNNINVYNRLKTHTQQTKSVWTGTYEWIYSKSSGTHKNLYWYYREKTIKFRKKFWVKIKKKSGVIIGNETGWRLV